MDTYNEYVNDYMNSYSCPDCNDAKLQSDKNARKINEVIDQVNQIIDNDIATTEYLLDKADEIVEEVAEIKVNEVLGDLVADIDNIQSSLDNIESKINRYVSEFGAKGDGVTDDTQAIKRALNEINDGSNLIFDKNLTYLISVNKNDDKLICNKNNINIIGNNATIKVKDNSGIIEGIINKNLTGSIFEFNGDNTKIFNLNLDGNYENNYYENEDGKYYAYHSDVNATNMPNGVVAISFIKAYCNNFTLQNTKIENFCGTGFSCGETTSLTKYKNIKVVNCVFRRLFRAGISFHHCENIEVLNSNFWHNQRHNIQFYTGNKNCIVRNCDITTNGSLIPKWYPSWTLGCADNETIGISFGHTSYGDNNDGLIVENNLIRTVNNGLQNGISLRSYPANVNIINNEISSNWFNIAFHSGVRGKNLIKGNIATISDVFLCIYMNKGENNYVIPSDVETKLTVDNNNSTCNNFISFKNLEDNNANEFFKSLEIEVINNTSNRTSIITGIDNVITMSKTPTIKIEVENNTFADNNLLTNSLLMSRSVKIKNKEDVFKLLSRRPGDFDADCSYVKIAKIRGNKGNILNLKGNITQYMGTSYFFNSDIGITIRFNTSDTSNNPSLVDMIMYNNHNLSKDIFKFIVTEKKSDYTEGYLYVNYRSYFTLNLEILYSNAIIEFIDDRKYYNNYQETSLQEYISK